MLVQCSHPTFTTRNGSSAIQTHLAAHNIHCNYMSSLNFIIPIMSKQEWSICKCIESSDLMFQFRKGPFYLKLESFVPGIQIIWNSTHFVSYTSFGQRFSEPFNLARETPTSWQDNNLGSQHWLTATTDFEFASFDCHVSINDIRHWSSILLFRIRRVPPKTWVYNRPVQLNQ